MNRNKWEITVEVEDLRKAAQKKKKICEQELLELKEINAESANSTLRIAERVKVQKEMTEYNNWCQICDQLVSPKVLDYEDWVFFFGGEQ